MGHEGDGGRRDRVRQTKLSGAEGGAGRDVQLISAPSDWTEDGRKSLTAPRSASDIICGRRPTPQDPMHVRKARFEGFLNILYTPPPNILLRRSYDGPTMSKVVRKWPFAPGWHPLRLAGRRGAARGRTLDPPLQGGTPTQYPRAPRPCIVFLCIRPGGR